jgi:hypothetical protein
MKGDTVSFALPLAPSHRTTSARLLLAGGHVLAAAIVIPGLTWAIGERRDISSCRTRLRSVRRCPHTTSVGSQRHTRRKISTKLLRAVSDRVRGVRSGGERPPRSDLVAKLGRRLVFIGLAVVLAGSGWVLALVDHSGTNVSRWALAPALFVIGTGLCFVTIPTVALGDAKPDEAGSASGSLSSIQQLASATSPRGPLRARSRENR